MKKSRTALIVIGFLSGLVILGVVYFGNFIDFSTDETGQPRKDTPRENTEIVDATSKGRPVYIIGLDGGSWDFLTKLIDQGRMPTLKALRDGGAWGDLMSLDQKWVFAPERRSFGFSPAIWTSIATGKLPEVHGVMDFIEDLDDPDFEKSATIELPPRTATAKLKISSYEGCDGQTVKISVNDEVIEEFWLSKKPTTYEFKMPETTKDRGAIDLKISPTCFKSQFEFTNGEIMSRRLISVAIMGAEAFDDRGRMLGKLDLEDEQGGGIRLGKGWYDTFEGQTFNWSVKFHQVPVSSITRKTKALWNIASENSRSVGILGWWATWPAEKVNGFVVSNHFSISRWDAKPEDGKKAEAERSKLLTHPPNLINDIGSFIKRPEHITSEELAQFVGDAETRLNPNSAMERHDYLSELRWAYSFDASNLDAAEYLLTNKPKPDLFAIYLEGLDINAHFFYRFFEPEHFPPASNEEAALFGNTFQRYAEWLDSRLGKLIKLFPDDAIILVVSDHGFGPGGVRMKVNISGEHRREGIIIAKGEGIIPGKLKSAPSVLDIAPTVLHLLALPIAEDMTGAPILELLSPKAFPKKPDRISTYESGKKPAVAPKPSASEYDKDYLEKLRSLGYIK